MTAFPNSPVDGQIYTLGARSWTYSDAQQAWILNRNGPTGPTGIRGPTGPQGALITALTVDSFVGNGIQTTYTLSELPISVFNLLINVDGLIQTPNINFTLSGMNVIFDEAPINNAMIDVIHLQIGSAATGPAGLQGPQGPTGPRNGSTGPTGPTGITNYPKLGIWTGLISDLSINVPIYCFVAIQPFIAAINFAGSRCVLLTAPAANISFPLMKNNSVIGSINFLLGQTTGTFSVSVQQSFSPGDTLIIMGPNVSDGTADNLSVGFAILESP